MGDPSTIITEDDLRQMLRRSTFGPSIRDLRKNRRLVGNTRGDVVEHLLKRRAKPPKFNPHFGRTILHDQWVRYLTRSKTPLIDRLALFWHDHFSVRTNDTSQDLVSNYLLVLYDHALGNFKDFVKAINRDGAMMVFLNTDLNVKILPNENYARELCELFTLGVEDLNGVSNYEQEDVVQIARAFTGWGLDGLDPNEHDTIAEFPERGPKVLFKGAHGFGAGGASFASGGEGEGEIDEVIEILFSHRDSDGQLTVARRTTYRLLEYFCYANPSKTLVDEIVAASNFETDWSLESLVRTILTHDVFFETMNPAPFDENTKVSIKWPIDFVLSTLRMLNVKPKGRALQVPAGSYKTLWSHLNDMGQLLGNPPSVFGWDWEEEWISSNRIMARYTFARDLITNRDGSFRFRPDKIIDTDLTDPDEIIEAALRSLNMSGQLEATDVATLRDYLTDGGAVTSLDLNDDQIRSEKLHGLYGLLIQSPYFQLQ